MLHDENVSRKKYFLPFSAALRINFFILLNKLSGSFTLNNLFYLLVGDLEIFFFVFMFFVFFRDSIFSMKYCSA